MQFLDKQYQETIRTVELFDINTSPRVPITQLGKSSSLVLEFDDLTAEYRQCHIKIFHCTADWQKSEVNEMDYLDDFNDFIINEYEISRTTKIPYFHYLFQLPNLKISGNYVLVVYADYHLNEPLLSKRFMIYEPLTSAALDVVRPPDNQHWKTHQQLGLQVDYKGYSVRSARNEFKVIIRQNYRWDKQWNVAPTTDNVSAGTLYFRYFSNENTVGGGNEFRHFDARNAYTRGAGVLKTQQGRNSDEVWLLPQKNRSDLAYVEWQDQNGTFVISNPNGENPAISNDYIWVNFGLKTEELENDVYVLGQFNQWEFAEKNKATYDLEFEGYTARLLLKQGRYDYAFSVKETDGTANETYFEGNFTDTENAYEVFIYHKPPAARAERLIGYQTINSRKGGR